MGHIQDHVSDTFFIRVSCQEKIITSSKERRILFIEAPNFGNNALLFILYNDVTVALNIVVVK